MPPARRIGAHIALQRVDGVERKEVIGGNRHEYEPSLSKDRPTSPERPVKLKRTRLGIAASEMRTVVPREHRTALSSDFSCAENTAREL